MPRAILVVLVALSLLAAGCREAFSNDREWASAACVKAATWQAQIEPLFRRVAFDEERRSLVRDSAELRRVIRGIVDEVDTIPAPKTDEGRRGRELLVTWAHRFDGRAGRFRDAIRSSPGDRSLSVIFFRLAGELPERVVPVVGIAVGGELRRAFADADSCRKLDDEPPTPPFRPFPSERWPSTVCTRLSAYETELIAVLEDVHAMRVFPNVATRSRALADITQAERAMREVVADVKAIPPPEIRSGLRAKRFIDFLVDTTAGERAKELAKRRVQFREDLSGPEIARLLEGPPRTQYGVEAVLAGAVERGYDLGQLMRPPDLKLTDAAKAFADAVECQAPEEERS